MIIKEHEIDINDLDLSNALSFNENYDIYKQAVYFDLEHYVYKKPKCIGVFGAGYFNEEKSKFITTQYMIEHKGEVRDILYLAKKYFIMVAVEKKKKYIVTFSGNNDFTVINYLFDKYYFSSILFSLYIVYKFPKIFSSALMYLKYLFQYRIKILA